MSKRVQITPVIAERLAATYGATVNADDYIVYEAVALNTLPLSQPGSIFDKGVVSEATLTEMAALLQRGDGIPLIAMHDTGMTPVGKVFWGDVSRDAIGRPSLKVQFYVSKSEPSLIAKIDDGSIAEVSVGFQAQHLNCSKCGFDFLGSEADMLHVFTKTCANGHVVGQDGVHLKVVGLNAWHELSLVGKGAANGAKILPQAAGQDTALAANGASGKALILQLTAVKEKTMPDPVLVNLGEITGLVNQLATANTELATAKGALTDAQAQVTALTAQVSDLEQQLQAAQAKQPTAEEQAAAEAATKAAETTLSFLKDQHTKLHVALGQKDVQAPESMADLIAGITAAQAKLSSLIPAGGRTAPAGAGTTGSTAVSAAFKSRK